MELWGVGLLVLELKAEDGSGHRGPIPFHQEGGGLGDAPSGL